ncbi:epoxyqueuosine reductase [Jeotgalicoccus aerolatus]|uniref:Epoxyqueuosine reductase n=1 Tax=Jeotgalicoccus aerolatus TaxID=709510 RepID=A0A1G9CRC0_9STAP|nr:tRNA epoxyqueuosine(34) reductase QueG [Jeotgalicoccus aerolatus]NMA80945.1 tRNA epoxyqueuosine(34) reductase QueG [Jeotgalicoccus aerolatus]SDK54220.1 epoxyqueuosine reductase [Jeotgalicoccus aerolatus]HJG32932.1 tRNA epoxyqueuosine(34) reductase QueG [Jeotgalicoccus aerolatus]
MDRREFKNRIIEYAHSIGIDDIGFTTAEPFTEFKAKLIDYYKNGYESGFETGTIEERTNPKASLPNAKSIISIAVGYPNKLRNAPKSKQGERRGIFARASWGMDYHTLLRSRLEKLEAYIKQLDPDIDCKSMVDTGVLSDREVARRSGLGFVGKNGFVINPKLGTYSYLGEMIVSYPFPADEELLDSCGDCNICVDRCPTGALVGDGQLDSKKCISFLTQTKGFMPVEYRSKIGNRLYGCDTCQQVCPRNRGINTEHHEDIVLEPEILKPELTSLLQISNRDFKETYGHLAGVWRGKKPIQRNAIIALAHFKERSALDILKSVAETDMRPVIKGTAYWAIGQIAGDEALDYIHERYGIETDDDVKKEMLLGIQEVS